MGSGLGNITRRDFFGVAVGAAVVLAASGGEEELPKRQRPSVLTIDDSLEKYYNEAMSKFSQGEKETGLNMLLKIDREFPNSPLAHFLAGNAVYYNLEISLQERHAWALERYNRAISLDKNFVEAYVNRGIIHYSSAEPTAEEAKEMLRTGDFGLPAFRREAYRKAITDLDKAAKLKPSFSTYFNKGVVLMHSNRELEAVPEFHKAIKIGLKNKSWEDYPPKIQDEAVTEVLVGAVPFCMVSGFAKYILDNHTDKVKGYRIAVQEPTSMIYLQNENDPEAFANFHLGSCYARKNVKDYDMAVKHYSKAIELNPDVPSFYQLLGIVQFGTGKYLESQLTLKKHAEVCRAIAKLASSYRAPTLN